jgi:hypothetical protein
MTWSPLTDSNRRPSPYHPHFSRFTARQASPPKDNSSACLALAVASGTTDDMVIESDAKQHPGTGSMPSEQQHLRRLACRSGPARVAAYRPVASTPTVR